MPAMSLGHAARPATRLEIWTVRLGIGMAVFAVAFISWAMADIDGDGMASIEEMQRGTNPLNGDSDGDGGADGWEVRHDGDPNAPDLPGLPCGVLADCPPEGPAAGPVAPKVSSGTAVASTIAIGLLAAVAAVALASIAGRRMQR